MKIRDETLLSWLRALGRRSLDREAMEAWGSEDTVSLLGLPESDLTPPARAALAQLIGEVAQLHERLASSEGRVAELERLADEDALAPISNRRAFLRDLDRTIGYVERYGAACSVLYFDVNGLKVINDTFGHAAGDAALIHVAGLLRGNTRSSDVVGRLGGDEFGVLLARAGELAATAKAGRLATVVAKRPLAWQGQRIAMSVAFGAHRLTAGEDAQTALAAADRAMYRQKRASAGKA
jgi:diguanylate cyclase (GGDEF)-like protein